ncbi:general odorant-binding protein 70 [Thrips palmi]|uniref:General odorant-binding protein 70 n=1 Tax=Thrips palmi TaxID=161013 RepID=A0A6P8YLJ3_THRPL|nr:general odorant-binding protein 70 [Thrips palmi]
MHALTVVAVAVLAAAVADAAAPQVRGRCATPPAAPQRIEKVINECQDDIKLSIIEEALSVLGESATELISKEVKGRAPAKSAKSRAKRQAFTEDERRIAGCLLHCVYKKVKALNPAGVPTGEGLVKLYAEGVQDASYFLATAQAVNHCLGAAQQQGRLLPQSVKEPGQKCYLAYDLFECVSDQIIEYCGASP